MDGPASTIENRRVAPSSQPPQSENALSSPVVNSANLGQDAVEELPDPLPIIRDTLYDDAAMVYRNYGEMKRPEVWEADQRASSTADINGDNNLASLYRPPYHLMFRGSFQMAKDAASAQDKWLLVNIQSDKEFRSHMLNLDTWRNETVGQMVGTNFIFWQVYDDSSEGMKICTFYKLDSIPVVLVIDPITGQNVRAWTGMVQPDTLLENLLPFMECGPRDHLATLSSKCPREISQAPPKNNVENNQEGEELQREFALSMEGIEYWKGIDSDSTIPSNADEEEEACATETGTYPLLPEEPQVDRRLLCRVALRFPDGRRIQRSFLKTDPIQLLWSLCYSEIEKTGAKPFRLAQGIPRATSLDYNSKLTFGESDLANSMIYVARE